MSFELIIQPAGGGPPRTETFNQNELTIGSVQGNDVVLPEANVDSRHARIVVRDGRPIIVDLKSNAGTFVNGKRLSSPMVLRTRDVVHVGPVRMMVRAVHRETGTEAGPETGAREEQQPGQRRSGTGPEVVVEFGGKEILRLPLTVPSMTIGRDPKCEIHLENRALSRRHTQLEQRGATIWVRDLDSQNGTYVNGKRIEEPLALHGGDVVELGRYRVLIEGLENVREERSEAIGAARTSSWASARTLVAAFDDAAVVAIGAAPGETVRIDRGTVLEEHGPVDRSVLLAVLQQLGVELSAAGAVFDGPSPRSAAWHVTAHDLDGTGPWLRMRRRPTSRRERRRNSR